MTLRSPRERALQTVCFEAGGLLLSVPLYVLVTGSSGEDGFIVVAAMAAAVMLWSAVHNSAWDWVEFCRTGRVASDRPQAQRVLHALSHEVTSLVVTVPVLMWLGGHDLWTALFLDFGLTLFYTGYAYVFHLVYDRVRPVRAAGSVGPLAVAGRA
jgi:uncharacterized membrane protein